MKINMCPSLLTPGYNGYSPVASRRLFGATHVRPFIDYDFDKDVDGQVFADNVGRLSISGVQEKVGAVVDDGVIRLTDHGERGTHILKPAPLDYGLTARRQIPANEHLTMQIASQVYGIPTAHNGLCFDLKNRPVYITRRFDIMLDGNKVRMEDFATLCQRNESVEGPYFKYSGCYEEIALAIRRYIGAWPVALDRFFRLIVFNYIYGNGDAHMKNFSVIHQGEDMMLAPAYDLINTSLHLDGDDFGLKGGLFASGWKSDIYALTGHPCRDDFLRFGEHVGLSAQRVQSVVDEYSVLPGKTLVLVGNSFLEKKMQRKYIAIVKERIARFCRMCSDE